MDHAVIDPGGIPAGLRIELNLADDSRLHLAFPTLDETQIKGLEPFGERKHFHDGEVVWTAGAKDV
ncbi:MAG: hypothetical protein QOJ65_2646, partial [Fimbriimonadaceae bacterium]|nr:hypothetical protein [Fimbriimonadaceae bacterium]